MLKEHEMGIYYSHNKHEPGFLRFEYRRFYNGNELTPGGFSYKPAVDKYGYILRPTW